MNVGYDIRPLIFTKAGIATYLYNLIANLARLSDGDIYLFSSSSSRIAWRQKFQNVKEKVVRLPQLNRYFESLWGENLLPLAIKRGKIDVFHGPRFFVPQKLSCPSVVTVHDLGFKKFPELVKSGVAAYFDEMVASSVKRARKVIVLSHATRKDLIDLYKVADGKIAVIYCAADKAFSPVTDKAAIERVKLKFSIRKKFILFAGTVEPRKNIVNLLEAYRMAKAKDEFDLVVAGGYGWLYDEVLRKASQPELQSKVVFTDYISSEDMACLYSGCEAFVFPSFYEGFGLPVLEAMNCGAPVITSSTSSLKELFADSSYQVDPHSPGSIAEGIDNVLSNAALRDELRTKGAKRSKDFSWEATARQTLEAYKEAIS